MTKPLLYTAKCQGGFIENYMPSIETLKKNLVVVGFHEQQLPSSVRIGSSFVKILDDEECSEQFPIDIIYQRCALSTTQSGIITLVSLIFNWILDLISIKLYYLINKKK